MRVCRLKPTGETYTSHAHLVLGDWSRLSDTNTLIDTGRDPGVLDDLVNHPTGVGKTPVDQIILTHSHYDHVELVGRFKEAFGARVLAWSPHAPLVDHVLSDGERVRAGDRECEVIHTPGHTDDSVCLYEPTEQVLFAGDTTLCVNSVGGDYDDAFIDVLERLSALPIRAIYFGHGEPLLLDCAVQLRRTLAIVSESRRRYQDHLDLRQAIDAPGAHRIQPPQTQDGMTL
jgi:glyoxylase-like metal-dependent hydrolase (beta-lactamase superfamily II)